MNSGEVKLSYIAAQSRVRCEFSKAICDANRKPPQDLIQRAKKKLEAEKKDGKIHFYRFFETRLKKVWQIMRDSRCSKDTVIAVTLASGAPVLKGLVVEASKKNNELGLITITATPEEVKKWQHFYLKLAIGRELRELDIIQPPNGAQLKRLLFRARSGIKVEKIPLMPIPEPLSKLNSQRNPFRIVEEEESRDITLIIEDVNLVSKEIMWNNLLDTLEKKINERNKLDDSNYIYLYNDIVRTLRSAQRGPERFGLDLPVVILAAIDEKYLDEKSIDTLQTRKPLAPKVKPKPKPKTDEKLTVKKSRAKLFEVLFSTEDEGLTAIFNGFGKNGDKDAPKSATPEDVAASFAAVGLCEDTYKKFIEPIATMITEGKEVVGEVIAEAIQPIEAADPALNPVYKIKNIEADENGNIDIRNLQGQSFVKKGDVIAKLEYKVKAKDGVKIDGKVIKAKIPLSVEMTLGEGVIKEGDVTYIADNGGIPDINGFTINLEKMLLHEGDVNLASGYIYFDGPATITGTIDHGAKVNIKEDLTVGESIVGGETYCGGDLIVTAGLNTAPDGIVKCKKSIKVGFSDNSIVYCLGAFTAEKGIASSEIYAGGKVFANNITGSLISCNAELHVQDLGREGSRRVRVMMGVDLVAEKSVDTRNLRLEKLVAYEKEIKNQHRLLNSKSSAQKTKKHEEKEAEVLIIKSRIKGVIEKAKSHLAAAKKSLIYEKDGVVLVDGTLASGTEIQIGKKKITVGQSVIEVAVIAKKSGNLEIMSQEEYKQSLAVA